MHIDSTARVSVARRCVSKISPTILYVFWVHPWFWAPRSAQKRHLEALLDRFLPDPSADARTPQNGVLSALFAPRSLQEGQRDRETKHALHSHKAITFGMFDGSPVHRKERGALGWHFHGGGGHPTTALQMARFGAPRCPNSRSKPKPRHLIGKKIILILLTKPMHRETASRRY